MLRKFRLLLTTAFAATLLVACGSETNENASIDDSSEDAVEVQATETEIAAADDTDSADAATSSTEENSDEDETTAKDTEKTTKTPTEETEKPAESADEATETADAIDPLSQTAIEQILALTGLSIEEHSYYISETTEEYVEVEISEKTEQENTPLVGIFRYFPDSGEIQVNDYLTGEFIPYEDLKQE